jgi:four helix bundle protein
MIKYQCFDELPAWQEAGKLYNRVLDLLEEPNLPLSGSFRTQLERAALAVSTHITESRDRTTTEKLLGYLVQARAAAAEVQSMVAVVSQRPKLARLIDSFQQIRGLAEACARQLSAWITTIEHGPRTNKQEATDNTPHQEQSGQQRKWSKPA